MQSRTWNAHSTWTAVGTELAKLGSNNIFDEQVRGAAMIMAVCHLVDAQHRIADALNDLDASLARRTSRYDSDSNSHS